MGIALNQNPTTIPEPTLLSDDEVEAFFGTIPSLTDNQLCRLETLTQIELDKRVFENEIEERIAAGGSYLRGLAS